MRPPILTIAALLLAGCATTEPHDRYGMTWEYKFPALIESYESVNDQAFFEICQQPIRDEDQACAVRDYVFRKNCTIYTRSEWRYDNPAGVREHELKHCAGYDHPEVYRGDIAAILRR